MDITICNNLKELRKKKDNTQEDLAEFLTVSIAAVSKWERGESYPDIELLPRIAAYYDVSVDDLLGVGDVKKKEKIREYNRQKGEFYKSGDTLANVELWRSAAKEFPNDNDVMFSLLIALSNATLSDKADETKKNEYLKEAVEVGEALSAKANDQTIMYWAMDRLSTAYKDLGEVDKAVKVANKIPPVWLNKEEALIHILEGAELKTHLQEFLLQLITRFTNMVGGFHRCDYDDEQTIQIYSKAIQIIKLFFEDGDYGTQHISLRSWYSFIAKAYAKTNDTDAVIENLSKAAEHAIAYDLFEENVSHTSLLFNTQKTKRAGKTYTNNESQNSLTQMANEQFDFCRDDERFAEIINKLTAVAREDMNTH